MVLNNAVNPDRPRHSSVQENSTFPTIYHFFSTATARSPSSSEDSNDDEDRDSKSEEESDSSDDTFVKESYFSSSSVWRSYTTRGQVKGNKEGKPLPPSTFVQYRHLYKFSNSWQKTRLMVCENCWTASVLEIEPKLVTFRLNGLSERLGVEVYLCFPT